MGGRFKGLDEFMENSCTHGATRGKRQGNPEGYACWGWRSRKAHKQQPGSRALPLNGISCCRYAARQTNGLTC